MVVRGSGDVAGCLSTLSLPESSRRGAAARLGRRAPRGEAPAAVWTEQPPRKRMRWKQQSRHVLLAGKGTAQVVDAMPVQPHEATRTAVAAATAGAATADAAAAGAAAADAMLSQKLFDLRGRWTEDEGTDGGRAGEPLVPGASIAVRSALWCIQNPFKIPLAVY